MKPYVCYLTAFASLLALNGTCQYLNESFNTGIPTGWTQNAPGTWSMNPSLGFSNSACAITEEPGSSTLTVSLRTPTLNLTGVTNLTITFKAAVTKNNFVGANVVLYYQGSAGPQQLASWGTGFNTTTYTITEGFDPSPPLDAGNVNWVNCTHTVAAVNGNTVSFLFNAEFVNGGYVLLDDIKISGKPASTADISSEAVTGIYMFPNPVTDKKLKLTGAKFTHAIITNAIGEHSPARITFDREVFEIGLDGLPAGVYYIHVITHEGLNATKKIVIE